MTCQPPEKRQKTVVGNRTCKQIIPTSVGCCKFSINFAIPEFSSLKDQQKSIFSERLTADELGLSKGHGDWFIGVIPSRASHADKPKFASVSLWRTPAMVGSFEVLLYTRSNAIQMCRSLSVPDKFLAPNNQPTFIGLEQLILHTELFNPNNRPDWLPDDTLSVHVIVELTKITVPSADHMAKDFALLLSPGGKHNVYSDLALISSDGAPFHVNRAFLQARARFFAAKLSSNTRQGRHYHLKDVDGNTLLQILEFLHGGQIPDFLHAVTTSDVKTHVDALLRAANTYQLAGLMVWCTDRLILEVRAGSVCSLLELSHGHPLPRLKEACLKFMAVHVSEKVLVAYVTVARLIDAADLKRSCATFMTNHITAKNAAAFAKLAEDIAADELKRTCLGHMEANINGKNVEEFLGFTETRPADGLRTACLAFMAKNIRLDNVGDYLIIADTKKSPGLKEAALAFLKVAGNGLAFVNSAGFEKVRVHGNLMKEICAAFCGPVAIKVEIKSEV